MNDILPEHSPRWQHFEAVVRDWLAAYGYREMRTPIVEQTALFKRAIGEVTDIVEKEMYAFEDALNGEQSGAASGRHRRLRARRDPAQPAVQRTAAAVVRRADVPPRAPAKRSLPPVSPGRRGVARLMPVRTWTSSTSS